VRCLLPQLGVHADTTFFGPQVPAGGWRVGGVAAPCSSPEAGGRRAAARLPPLVAAAALQLAWPRSALPVAEGRRQVHRTPAVQWRGTGWIALEGERGARRGTGGLWVRQKCPRGQPAARMGAVASHGNWAASGRMGYVT
jgi:hypothetical protein